MVLQKLPQSTQNFILSNPSLLKFWSYLLSQPSHFGSDAIGFALVSKINKDIWVINEIQTDVINQYLNLRNSYKRDNSKPSETMSWETLSDMLDAQNRSNWIPKLQANEAFRNQVLNNPNIIQQLPDNSVDIDKWIAEQQAGGMAGRQWLNLIENYSNKTIIISSITKTTKKIKISKKMWEEAGRKNKWI